MAIRTQQAKISCIGVPIAEAVPPRRGRAANLGRCIDMIDVERAEIVKPALNAFSAERLYQRQFAVPILRLFMGRCAILVPIGFLALRGTISNGARFAALFARPISGPSVCKVARAAAIFSAALAQAVRVHLRWLSAAGADNHDRCCSHGWNVAQKPKYFDIACRRISEALKQPDMFIEKPKPAKQEALEL